MGAVRVLPRSAAGTAPLVVVCAGATVIALLAVLVGMDVETAVIDEGLHKLQAVRYAEGFPGAFVFDPVARSTARLYSLALAPAFALAGGDTAIGAARVISASLFASAAVPTFFLAREVVTSRWLPVVAGLMSVAVPWLTLSTALYTENLAYPLFVWVAWSVVRSMHAPSARRDLFVIGLIAAATWTRPQLAVLFLVYVMLVVVRVLRDRPRGLRLAARKGARAFPITSALLVVGLAGVIVTGAAGRLDGVLGRGLGPYRGILERDTAPSDLSLAFSAELAAIALGVGVLPAVLATAWFVGALRRPATTAWWPALTSVVSVAAVWATALFAQGGYLGPATEERYYLYAVPVLWVGAVAALEDHSLRRATLAVAALPFAVALATVPLNVGLNPTSQFLTPVLAAAGNITARILEGVPMLGMHDVLVLVALVVVGAAMLAWRRPRARAAVLVAPVVVQIGLAGYAFAAVAGDVPGVEGRVGDRQDELAWVDESLDGDREVTLVRGGTAADRELELNFWNGGVRHFVDPPGRPFASVPYPLNLLGYETADVGGDGEVRLDGLRARAVQDPLSTQLQLAGRRLANGPEGTLALIEPIRPARARWATRGLEADGVVTRSVELTATPPSGRGAFAVTLELEPPANTATVMTVRLGGTERRVELPAAQAPAIARTRITGCGPARGVLEPTVSAPLPDGRPSAGKLLRVEVRQLRDGCPAAEPAGR